MSKYKSDAELLLKYIGGKENIAAVTHCATRMRFVLNDAKLADEEAIGKLSVVKGMFTNAGQFQVIIGNNVSAFYNDFSVISGIEGVSKEQSKAAAKQNQSKLQQLVGVLAEIFTPLLPAIIVGGLILGFRNILEGVQIESLGQKIVDGIAITNPDGTMIYNAIADVSTFWSGVNHFLWLPGEAIFHFLPVGITWSITRKMGTTQILGIILGITLVSPQLLNAYAVNGTAAADIPFWDFGFAQVNMIGYQAQVIPAMLAGFMLVYLERFFRKWIPESISMIFVPLLSLLPAIFFAHTILGPIGWTIGSWISTVVNVGLTSSISWLFAALFGVFYAPLVITGLHHTTLAIDSQLIADFGATNLWPMIALSNIAQGAAVLGIIVAHRGNKEEEQVSIPSLISAWLGVTEPAMFGINLKYVYPFVAGMIGSGVAAMFITLSKVKALSIGVGGLPGILAIRPQDYLPFIIGIVIAIIVPFILTLFFRKAGIFNKLDPVADKTGELYETEEPKIVIENQSDSVNGLAKAHTKENLFSPCDGVLIPISSVDDSVFSQKMMGEGFAVQPTLGKVFSPIRGQVMSVFNTQHAIGLVTESGAEVLVHMGIDTVELKGIPFNVHIKAGQQVTEDTLLADVDLDLLAMHEKQSDIIVVITNSEKVEKFVLQNIGEVEATEAIGDVLIVQK